MAKTKKAKGVHYVDNKKFLVAMVEFKEKCTVAKENEEDQPIINKTLLNKIFLKGVKSLFEGTLLKLPETFHSEWFDLIIYEGSIHWEVITEPSSNSPNIPQSLYNNLLLEVLNIFKTPPFARLAIINFSPILLRRIFDSLKNSVKFSFS